MHRKADFKKGIADKTRARDEKQTSIRKNKREIKLGTRRQVPVALEQGSDFHMLLQRFNPQAQDLTALKTLNQLIKIAEPHELERHIISNVMSYIPVLVRKCESLQARDLEQVEVALSCLVNLTHAQLDQDAAIAHAIFQAGFMTQTVPIFMTSFHQGKNECMNVSTRSKLWDLITNLALACPEARDYILQSPFMGFNAESDASKSPFIAELKLLFDSSRNEVQLAFLPIVCYAIVAMLSYTAKKPPYLFSFAMWPYLLRMCSLIQPMRMEEMPVTLVELLPNLYNALYLILYYESSRDREQSTLNTPRMLLMSDMKALLTRMREMHTVSPRELQFILFQVVSKISEQELDLGVVPRLLIDTKWDQMFLQGVGSRDPRVREKSLYCIGNMLADGTPYVTHMTHAGLMKPLILTLNNDRSYDVREKALYCFYMLFAACDADRQDMALRNDAEAMMRTVIKEHKVFQHILPYIVQEGASKLMVRDALKVLCAALEWDYEYVMNAIGDRGTHVIDTLMDKLNNMKGRMDNDIFTLACRADDLLNHRNDDAARGDYFVMTNTPAEPGVMQGQFTF